MSSASISPEQMAINQRCSAAASAHHTETLRLMGEDLWELSMKTSESDKVAVAHFSSEALLDAFAAHHDPLIACSTARFMPYFLKKQMKIDPVPGQFLTCDLLGEGTPIYGAQYHSKPAAAAAAPKPMLKRSASLVKLSQRGKMLKA